MNRFVKKTVVFLFVALSCTMLFAQKKTLSSNGVSVPDWMSNSYILNSDFAWNDGHGRSIYNLFSSPTKNTKIKRISVKGDKVKIESEQTDGDGNVMFHLIAEFVCHKLNNGGTCYTSFVQFDSPITFKSVEIECSGPDDARRYGQCLGILYELCTGDMFNDEIGIANEKARKEEIAKEQAKQKAAEKSRQEQIEKENEIFVNDFASRNSDTYIDDFLLNLGSINISSFDDNDYNIRLYSIANRASVKAGYSPVYYQEKNDTENYDSSTWFVFSTYWENQSSIKMNENADGFFINGKTKDSLILIRKDFVHKKIVYEERKILRNKEDESYIAEVLKKSIREEQSGPAKILYKNYYMKFNANNYGSNSEELQDLARIYSILNKASIQSGFSPCYYQNVGNERIYDSDKWNLGDWDSWKCEWTNLSDIKLDNKANGFRFSKPESLYRIDSEYFVKKAEQKQKEKGEKQAALLAEREAKERKQNEKLVGEVLSLRVSRKSDKKLEYEQISLPVDDFRQWAILNWASEKAGYSPCYYQEQNGIKIFDPNLWIKEKDSNKSGYSNKDSIKESPDADGFRFDSKGFSNCILCRKNIKKE